MKTSNLCQLPLYAISAYFNLTTHQVKLFFNDTYVFNNKMLYTHAGCLKDKKPVISKQNKTKLTREKTKYSHK